MPQCKRKFTKSRSYFFVCKGNDLLFLLVLLTLHPQQLPPPLLRLLLQVARARPTWPVKRPTRLWWASWWWSWLSWWCSLPSLSSCCCWSTRREGKMSHWHQLLPSPSPPVTLPLKTMIKSKDCVHGIRYCLHLSLTSWTNQFLLPVVFVNFSKSSGPDDEEMDALKEFDDIDDDDKEDLVS